MRRKRIEPGGIDTRDFFSMRMTQLPNQENFGSRAIRSGTNF